MAQSLGEQNAEPERFACLVLAAGASSRMRGEHKLLRHIQGTPLLAHVLGRLAPLCAALDVYVVLPTDNPALDALLPDAPFRIVWSQEAAEGMGASIRAGAGALMAGNYRGVILLFADMPDITPRHITDLITAYEAAEDRLIIVPRHNGQRGHPVLFDRRYLPQLLALRGDKGARDILKAAGGAVYELESDRAVITDLDTPEDWDKWQAEQGLTKG